VRKAISPIYGIPSKHKFFPAIAEIKEFLETEMAPIRREEVRRAVAEENARSLPAPEIKAPKPKTRRYSYAEFLEMSGRGEVKPRPIGRFEI
jgi:hypothetical protein